jgi:chromosome segregation ATPase
MTNANDSSDDEPTHNYEPLESAIDTAKEKLDPIEDRINDTFAADIEEIEDILDVIEETVDDAQDTDSVTELAAASAQVEFLQAKADNISNQANGLTAEFEEYQVALEAVEDYVEDIEVEQSKWFARVNGIPLLYDSRTVKAGELIEDSVDPDDASEYSIEAYTSEVDEEADARYPDNEQDVPLGDFDEFEAVRDKGGGPVWQ